MKRRVHIQVITSSRYSILSYFFDERKKRKLGSRKKNAKRRTRNILLSAFGVCAADNTFVFCGRGAGVRQKEEVRERERKTRTDSVQ